MTKIISKSFLAKIDYLKNNFNDRKIVGLIHRVYLTQLKNTRNYTASTKTRSEVRGGGRKPWKQKGTGRARAGSNKSPLFVGGGIIFGPKPRTVFKKINKKERLLALSLAFYLKVKKKKILRIKENYLLNVLFKHYSRHFIVKKKTKKFLVFLKKLVLTFTSQTLIILKISNKELYKVLWLATRNFKNIEITINKCLNVKQLLKANHIIFVTN